MLVVLSLSSSEASRTGESGRGGGKPRLLLCFLSDDVADVDAGGEGGTGEDMYMGVPVLSSLIYSSQSISMKECLEDDEGVADATDIGLSERIDMRTNAAFDTPSGENEEEAS
jgi:hypothetical protein